ncbi:Proton-dependent oligopeptide transporter family [Parasponia andersonii]|uniref:Proton-dependent oligopeptide transporter family n=1 Tax=Parasponia andersonii TaxID=3476 RepID=A0A2P5B414_PARAD|nr:Proton-dependent oligopeptide transporter family [Parasponia andersonii]
MYVGLTWADKLAEYALWLMQTFLTNGWGIGYTTAATIINVLVGLNQITPIAMQHIVDSFMDNYWMALLCSCAYTSGLFLLSISAFGICSQDDQLPFRFVPYKSINMICFFTALGLLFIGKSSRALYSFKELVKKEDKRLSKSLRFLKTSIIIVVHLIGAFALSNIKEWPLIFGIPAICMLVATLVFLTGTSSYQRDKPPGSFLTTMRRVSVAAFSLRSSTHELNVGHVDRTRYGHRLRF